MKATTKKWSLVLALAWIMWVNTLDKKTGHEKHEPYLAYETKNECDMARAGFLTKISKAPGYIVNKGIIINAGYGTITTVTCLPDTIDPRPGRRSRE